MENGKSSGSVQSLVSASSADKRAILRCPPLSAIAHEILLLSSESEIERRFGSRGAGFTAFWMSAIGCHNLEALFRVSAKG
jgi:hypothetical protein